MDLHYTIDDAQLSEDWSEILSLASKPGASLEQVHVFCLAHVLRRPIIVYGVKYVKSWRGETLGFARFEGLLLLTYAIVVSLMMFEGFRVFPAQTNPPTSVQTTDFYLN